jgi:hypothetical protein
MQSGAWRRWRLPIKIEVPECGSALAYAIIVLTNRTTAGAAVTHHAVKNN